MAPSIPQRDDPTVLVRLGAALIPHWFPHLQKFPLWINQPPGIWGKKAFHTVLVSLESPFSPETQNLACSRFEKHSGASLKNVFLHGVMYSSTLRSPYLESENVSLRMCPAHCATAETFREGTTREALLHNFRFLWKQSNLGNEANTQSHRKSHWLMKDNRAWAGRVYCHTTGQECTEGLQTARNAAHTKELSPIGYRLIGSVGSGVVWNALLTEILDRDNITKHFYHSLLLHQAN